ncbi:chondroitinase-B domain-containing protein [Rubrivirga litoralis]|uniref:Chondroitinase-B domain-containing protein n=1 Tax=Rubrivirga litoralis TaxID=3075598 RepID=A0ABU3BNQ0_9BACT|nr:chondroitinase-B domain-containing protein [Rubrivirga sp. F394]MDT0630916.1 chondroitinase-B domain-containing protein [Rubrivirga sp. F394]
MTSRPARRLRPAPPPSAPPARRAGWWLALAALAVGGAAPLSAQPTERYVTTRFELATAISQSQPGDVITMADQRWTDTIISFSANGVEGDSIRLQAETPGGVILDGSSRLRIGGDYLVVDGLRFEGGAIGGGSVIEFRANSSSPAHHSRLTNTTIVDYNPPSTSTDYKWVSLYGTDNRVDHNYFAGKTHAGTTLVVWLEDEPDHEPNRHRIDHNHFGPRPPLGENGGETIRIGTSARSMQDSETTVEYNLFEKCDGEIETISNKSGKNVFRSNTFLSTRGSLTLRHGNGARVEGNFFLGNRLPDTGGIRVIGEDHVVVNNYLENLRGSGFRAGISIMNGVPNSPLNRYFQVKNVVIAHNTVVESTAPLVIGAGENSERTLPPENVTFANNVLTSIGGSIIRQDDEPVDMVWEANVAYGGSLGIENPGGVTVADPELVAGDDGLLRPAAGSPLLDAADPAFAVALDVDGQPRDATPDIGADERSDAPVLRRPLTAEDVGPRERPSSGGGSGPTASGEDPAGGAALALGLPYPNPTLGRATVPVRLAAAGHVAVRVYDVLGREVAVLVDGPVAAGEHRLAWDAARVPAGRYLVVAQAGADVARRAVVVAGRRD